MFDIKCIVFGNLEGAKEEEDAKASQTKAN
jgi:hypothetical protein